MRGPGDAIRVGSAVIFLTITTVRLCIVRKRSEVKYYLVQSEAKSKEFDKADVKESIEIKHTTDRALVPHNLNLINKPVQYIQKLSIRQFINQ